MYKNCHGWLIHHQLDLEGESLRNWLESISAKKLVNSTSSTKNKTRNLPYIGVAVLVWRGDYLLLGQRTGSRAEHEWQFPGGHLEPGETVLECAAREVLEETGLKIVRAEHADFSNETFTAGERDYVTLFVSATAPPAEPRVMEPDKCLSWQWFPYDQLPSPLFAPITNFLKQGSDLGIYRIDQGTQSGEQK